jgi:hypothetical protein
MAKGHPWMGEPWVVFFLHESAKSWVGFDASPNIMREIWQVFNQFQRLGIESNGCGFTHSHHSKIEVCNSIESFRLCEMLSGINARLLARIGSEDPGSFSYFE